MDRPRWTVLLAIGLLAGAIMLFEIALTRVFSFTIWHHYTFMVISVALLGFAASGVALQLRPRLGLPAAACAARYAVLFGVTAVLSVLFVTRVPFDPTHIATQPAQLFYLAIYYCALLVPFGLAGLALVTLLAGFASWVDRLYASDLVGAGLGSLVVVGAMRWVGAEGVILLAAAAAASAAWLLAAAAERPGRSAWPWLAAAVAFAAMVPWGARCIPIRPGPAKALQSWLDTQLFPHAHIAYTRWNAMSRIDVVEGSGNVRWTENPAAHATSPPQTQIIIDGDASTPIVASNGNPSELGFLDYMLSSAAQQAFHPARVLVIGSGGGVDVLSALHHGAKQVHAVEINPIIVELVRGRYAERSGRLFERPDVRLHVGEGRSFVRRQSQSYDLIQLSLIDTWAASASGAYSLAEGYLYTTEAFEDYITHLSSDGILTLTRWLWKTPRETLKLCTVAAAALRHLGIPDPEQHVVLVAQDNLGTLLVKRSAFAPADLATLRGVVAARGFKFLYAPDLRGHNPYTDFFRSRNPDLFLATYPYDVRPATDDSPFFFQFGRWRDASLLGAGWADSPFVLSGRLVLLATALQALVLSLALLVVPLLRRGTRGGVVPGGAPAATGRLAALLYFFSIGLAFMLLEITLMQRFTLYLGHPVYALAFVLAVLLVAAGAGSRFARRLVGTGRRPWPLFSAIAALVVLYAPGLPALFHATLGRGLGVRLALGTLLLFPLGFLLGAPFPAAIASLSQNRRASLVGWAWAANGCASVLGPILAVLLAMDLGFSFVMLVAALGYLVALAAWGRWSIPAPLPVAEPAPAHALA